MTDRELEAHFKVIGERLEKIEKAQGTFTTDLEKDRGDLHDFTVEVARLGAQIEALRKGQVTQTEKLADKVEEVVEPVIDETSKLKNMIKEKKFVPFKVPRYRFNFWNSFRK